MHDPIQTILGDLYQIDPAFKKYEKELQTLIERLLHANPQVQMNEAFSASLRKQLVQEAQTLMASNVASRSKVRGESGFAVWMKRFFYPFGGGILATLLVVALINPDVLPTQNQPDAAFFENEVEDKVIMNGEFDSIAYIDKRVAEVDASLTTCVKTEMPLYGQSTEGGLVTYYHKPAGLQKIKVELYGETGMTVNKYVYDNGTLMYVIHERHEYNRPIYWDENLAAEAGDSQVHDPEKTIVTQTLYYYDHDQLIRYIDEQGQITDYVPGSAQAVEGEFFLNRSDELNWRYESNKSHLVPIES